LNAYFEQRRINAVVETQSWGIKIDYDPYIIISDDEQYNIWDINQTNNPHVFELRTLKVSREPYVPFSHMFFDTVEKKIMRGEINDTNDHNNAYPFRGGVWYYIDLNLKQN
jgi:hypothetical protein